MIARLVGKVLFGATKFTVKYVVIPIAYTAALAYAMDRATERIRDSTKELDEVEPEIRPMP